MIETRARAIRTQAQRSYDRAATRRREEQLVREHLPLVKTVVGRLALTLPAHVDVEDLYSAGLMGLLQAIRSFDAEQGACFTTYARIRIQGAVLDELRRLDCVSRTVRDKGRRVQDALQRAEQRLGRLPTEAEVAAELGMTTEEYAALLDEVRPVTFVSLDAAAVGPDGDENLAPAETVADPTQATPRETAAHRELVQLIVRRLKELPEMQRKVLTLYYFEDLRLREIAEVFGVTESRICQIHAQAILALKSFLKQQEAGKPA
ncbi:MAG: FliA/WhiG family RNA polymerase sigma factor [Verrucomicrobiae bacterium]|nr:FliA/WhiG family RNA polymerase sigma factor [Verrucomicrobiae bacterium]MDW8343566.1 FliA/WhiG family RNA polymerase sigma factor [Verrucomicrobiae bacterium]